VTINNYVHAQFYVSKKVCVKSPPTAGSTSLPCDEPTVFFDTDLTSISSFWSFGDGGTSNQRNPSHSYLSPGPKIVTLSKIFSGATPPVTSSKQILVGSFPSQPKFNDKIEADTTVCDGKTVSLNPFKGSFGGTNYDYLWFPGGETTKTIDVDTSGCYSVEVKDKASGCSLTATIKVKFCLQDPGGGDPIEKWYLKDGSILQFTKTKTAPIPLDSLADMGEIINSSEFEDGGYDSKIIAKKHKLNTGGSTTVVYDPKKNLTFYSDGNKVYSGKDDSEIKFVDGSTFTGLGGNQSTAVFLVPKAGCIECPHHQYYLFVVDPVTKLLSYSILDMRYNDKKGAVTESNIPVAGPVTEQMTVKLNADESGFIIYSHLPNSNTFSITTVDSNGVNTQPQVTGTLQSGTTNDKNYFAISNDGKKLAQTVVVGGKNFVEVFDRDPTNNKLINPKLIDLNIAAPPFVYGLTFSKSGDFLYVSVSGDPTLGQTSSLIQLPLLLNNPVTISQQKNIIASSTTEKYGALQLGPIYGDGKRYVYLSIEGKNYLPYIREPEARGNAAVVGYTNVASSANNGVNLPSNNGLNLSNVIQASEKQEGEGVSANYSGNCFMASTILSTQGVCSPLRNEIVWEFEGGKTLKGERVSYVFPKIGWNKIKLRIKIFNPSPLAGTVSNPTVNKALETECKEKIYEGEIYIKPSPVFDLPEKLYLCLVEGEKKQLDANPTGGTKFFYNWQTSLNTTIYSDSAYTFFAPGPYKLEIKNNFNCKADDKISVFEGCEPRIFLPDAITPYPRNSKLDVFYAYITDYELNVYNRWGEVVFVSKDPDILWDGNVNKRTFGNQIYPYVITYRSKYFPERGKLSTKGTITIIR
jgi:CHU_C Type IX secretion signal domain/PKD domain